MGSKSVRIFFVAFYVIAVLLALNIMIAAVLDVIIAQKQEIEDTIIEKAENLEQSEILEQQPIIDIY